MIISEFEQIWNEDRSISYPDVVNTLYGVFNDFSLQISASSNKMLGLAAGSGMAELLMMQKLGLQRAVLVDIHPEKIDNENVRYEESDLLTYLESCDEKFAAVTLFGAEYVLKNRAAWMRFWECIDRVTEKGSFIFISNLHWNDSGVDQLRFKLHMREAGCIAEKIIE